MNLKTDNILKRWINIVRNVGIVNFINGGIEMDKQLTPRRIIALIMILVGLVLYFDGRDLKVTADNTMSYIMSPATEIINNPEALPNFDAETYLNTSISGMAGLSVDMIQFAGEAEAGVGAIVVGSILLFVRTMEWEKTFFKKVASVFLP
jgi:hypothetical protein